MDGSWKSHIETVDKRMNKVVLCLYTKAIMTDQKIHLINIMAAKIVEYRMSIVMYPNKVIKQMNKNIKKIAKRAMRIS
jgi:hypothetical protein